ncbi:MAG: hypothetical protein ACK40D_14530 [Cyanobacteriota bacterium]|jgi:hypothetical protein
MLDLPSLWGFTFAYLEMNSFWEDTYVGAILSGGAQGLVQGVANVGNGLQDAIIGVANLPAAVYNVTAGNLGGGTIGYIPSPDWSKDLVIMNDPTHELSKFVGGQGAFMLCTMGASSLGSAAKVTHLTSSEFAASIQAEGVINGAGGVFASTRVYSTPLANTAATFVSNTSGQVQIAGQAATLFKPVSVVGPISAWTRTAAGAYYAPFTNINLATGAATPVGMMAQWPVAFDACLGVGLQLGVQHEQGTLNW